jgi:hexosaminidase
MRRSAGFFLVLFLTCVSTIISRAADAEQQLRLLPEPKAVKLLQGDFRVGPETRILVEFGHQSEDRIAAETLAEEIADQSGLKIAIEGEKSEAKGSTGAIVLARLQDSAGVRQFLASKGLKTDGSIGDQGYLLFSDKSHVIVAANSGQGLFYGVQTLRQLLRPEGKELIFPAVAISRLTEPRMARDAGQR